MAAKSGQRNFMPERANDNLVYLPATEQVETHKPLDRDPPPPPPSGPDPSIRKFRAKRINEYVKAVYSIANTLAAATIVTSYIVPEIKRDNLPQELDRPMWVAVGLTIFLFGLAVIRWGYQRED